MALSSPARRPRQPLLLLALLLAALSSPCARAAASERRRVLAPAALPPALAPGRAWQEFHVAPPTAPRLGAGVSKNGEAAPRPTREWRRRVRRGRGGGTGAWTFSAMLPRGFVPPSGSSTCHNDMPATAADAQFFACSGAGTP
ncbi:hypothetical protein SEVIR_4G142900v4 [Setaria viridis]|uniref:Uncharacterized protein n=2 Tax=Setaria TaxID=4554 RepID=K3XZV2_SETIT|nr:uncharacterized protein LOC101786056 [Setaria italica]XP_034591990.1 uncharacterized protein LOC117853812 [Setaria viridis]RCV21886.1 hypothetical protein SETIT_4G174700v2 [Setaria italica]TKW21767.1 hypothetical protein SEVIR_4G142900v2 [Setaria viridis]